VYQKACDGPVSAGRQDLTGRGPARDGIIGA
jgi:hypothetical protein